MDPQQAIQQLPLSLLKDLTHKAQPYDPAAEFRLVGGCVRDALLGKAPKDYDVVTNASESTLQQMGLEPVGKAFPVYLYRDPQLGQIEIAVARMERKTGPGHKGFETAPTRDFTRDMQRRDLTINALSVDMNGELHGPAGALEHFEAKRFQHVSEQFKEDPLRVLRVARFAAQMPEWSVSPALAQTMTQVQPELETLPPDRIRNEMERSLMAQEPSRFFEVLKDTHCLTPWFSEVEGRWEAWVDRLQQLPRDWSPEQKLCSLCSVLVNPDRMLHLLGYSEKLVNSVRWIKKYQGDFALRELEPSQTVALVKSGNRCVLPFPEMLAAAFAPSGMASYLLKCQAAMDQVNMEGVNSREEAEARYIQALPRTASLLQKQASPMVVYHGTTFDGEPSVKGKPSGILWVTLDPQVAKNYAGRKGSPRVWEIELSPSAKLVDLRDLSDPFTQHIREQVNVGRRFTFGAVSPEQWPSYADFGLVEANPWLVTQAKAHGIYLLKVTDTSRWGAGEAVDSIAILSDKAILSTVQVEEKNVARLASLSLTASHGLPSTFDAWMRAQDAGITKADLQRIRPILREWVAGGWTDGPQLMRLLEKHKDILAKFRMSKPVRLWRNERAQILTRGGQDVTGPSNAGWEDQYTRPSAWSATRMHAESYASGNGRRLVTAIVPPEDTYCYIPLVEQAARALGMKTFDPHQQDEVIVRPNPSFLDQIRPKVTVGEEAQLRRDYELAMVEYHLPQLHELRKTNPKAISDEELKRRIADIAKHKEIHDVRDELAKLQRGKAARKNAGILMPGFSVKAACRPTRYMVLTQSHLAKLVFHGTPHDFEEFKLQHIGTGEGAQAYGYGLYFAGDKGVADYYRRSLSNRDQDWGADTAHQNAQAQVQRFGADYAAELIREQMGHWNKNEWNYKQLERTLQFIESGDYAKPLPNQGVLYEVNIPDGPYLLWDAPMVEQPDVVKHAVAKCLGDDVVVSPGRRWDEVDLHVNGQWQGNCPEGSIEAMSGERIYRLIGRVLGGGGDKAASLALHTLGIAGIKYLDGNSRNQGQGEHNYNYVLFSDTDAKVLTKRKAAALHHYQPKRLSPYDVLVTLDVAKVDASWRQDSTFYVGPGGEGQIKNRYQQFQQWLQDNPDTPIDPPDIGLTPSGEIIFGNGRHRFAVLRDQGAKRIAATVPRQDFKAMAERFGAERVQGTSVTAKTLYHGTSTERAQRIQREGLEPQVGDLVQQAYSDYADSVDYELEPLAFAGDKEALQRGVYSAMLHAIQAEGHDTSDEELAVRNWGALVVIKDGDEAMEHRPAEDGSYTEHPMQVETGDYYSRDHVPFDYILTGPTLVRYLKRHGVTLRRKSNKLLCPKASAPAKVCSVIQSLEFKAWFGKSVVVDDQGSPLQVYHGTNSTFDKFNRIDGGNMWGDGYYFTASPEDASNYATGFYNRLTPEGNAGPSVMPVYLRIVKPFYMDAPATPQMVRLLSRALGEQIDCDLRGLNNDYLRQYIWEQYTGDWEKTNEVLRKAGFDGLIGGSNTASTTGAKTYMVFSPNQIKSAIGNSGKFNLNDERLTASKHTKPFYVQQDLPPVEATQKELDSWVATQHFTRIGGGQEKEVYLTPNGDVFKIYSYSGGEGDATSLPIYIYGIVGKEYLPELYAYGASWTLEEHVTPVGSELLGMNRYAWVEAAQALSHCTSMKEVKDLAEENYFINKIVSNGNTRAIVRLFLENGLDLAELRLDNLGLRGSQIVVLDYSLES